MKHQKNYVYTNQFIFLLCFVNGMKVIPFYKDFSQVKHGKQNNKKSYELINKYDRIRRFCSIIFII